MELIKELKHRLENDDEPLTKRARLAKNVIFSDEFYLPKKENSIIKWFCDQLDKDETHEDIFIIMKDYFSFKNVDNFSNSHDLDDDTREQLLNVLKRRLNDDAKCTNAVIGLSTIVCNSNLMQQYLRRNINEYIDFVKALLSRITNRKHISHTLTNLSACFKHYENKSQALILFIENILPVLSVMYTRFEDNREYILDFVYQILLSNLPRNDYRNIIKYMCTNHLSDKSTDPNLQTDYLNVFLNLFCSFYARVEGIEDLQQLKNLLLIYFNSFFKLNKSDMNVAFQFFALFVKFLGFEIDNIQFNKSLKTVEKFNLENSVSCLQILFTNLQNVDIMSDVIFLNDLTFKTYIQNVIKTVLCLSEKPCAAVYQLLRTLIQINPNMAESMIDDILIHTIFKQGYVAPEVVSECSLFLIDIFKMFTRLHREQKLISVLLRASSKFLLDDDANQFVGFNFDDFNISNSFSNLVIDSYCEIIRSLMGKVSLGILRTFMYHFNNDIIENIETKSNDVKFKILYEFEVLLAYEYFMSVAIVDHIVPEIISTKFLNEMIEFKNILAKIGCKLLNMEHQCYLMNSYLKLCHSWGELYTFLYHFKFEEDEKCLIELSSNCLSDKYIHNYLSPDQWNTIYQRVANFGEQRCKQQLELLHSQINCLSQIIEIKLERLGQNQNHPSEINTFSKSNYLIFNNSPQELIQNAIENQNFDLFNSNYVQEDRSLIERLISHVLKKFKNEIKTNFDKNFQTYKLLKMNKNSNLFAQEEFSDDFSNIFQIFDENSPIQIDKTVKSDQILNLMHILYNLPLAYTPEFTRIKIILFTVCVHNDFTDYDQQMASLSENLLEMIIKTNFPRQIFDIIKLKRLLTFFVNFKNYETLVKIISEQILQTHLFGQLKKISKYLLKLREEKRFNITCTLFKLFKNTNYIDGLSQEDKNIILKVTYQLSEIVLNLFNVEEQEIAYDTVKLCLLALAIERCLVDDPKNILSVLVKHLNRSIDYCFTHLKTESPTEDSREHIAIFLNTLLKFKDRIQVPNLPDDILARCCLAVKKNIAIDLSNIFEQIGVRDLQIIEIELVDDIKQCVLSNSKTELLVLLRLWEATNSFKFKSPEHIEIRQTTVQLVLSEFLFGLQQYLDDFEMLLIILNYIYKLLKSEVLLTPLMIDFILDILFELKFSNITPKTTLENQSKLFLSITSILEIFVTSRYTFFFSKIQNVLILYRILLKQICESHNLKLEAAEMENIIAEWAHNFQKLVKLLTKDKKNVTRLTPYLIADILKYYETVTLYPTVKTHLNNSLYELLNVCDSHAISYLLRNLSEGSKTIFKVVHEDYNKFHRFIGRS